MIYTWNGEEFEFITDVLGVVPMGASAGDGQYFPVDHDETIQIPGRSLVLTGDGRYEIRIVEELREVAAARGRRCARSPLREVAPPNRAWEGVGGASKRPGKCPRTEPGQSKGKGLRELIRNRIGRQSLPYKSSESGIVGQAPPIWCLTFLNAGYHNPFTLAAPYMVPDVSQLK